MSCLFCRIINGEIPSKKAFENENIFAFYDIAPQAPVHILVIPKAHIESVDGINAENSKIVAEIFENSFVKIVEITVSTDNFESFSILSS